MEKECIIDSHYSTLNTFEISQLKIETINAPIKAAVNVATEKPFIRVPKYQKRAPLITSENNPRVRILIGRVNIFIIGFIIILNSVKQAPTIRAVHIGSMVIPEINLEVRKTATESVIQCTIIFMTNILFE